MEQTQVFDVPNTYVAPVTFTSSFPQNVISVDTANDQMIVEGGFWMPQTKVSPGAVAAVVLWNHQLLPIPLPLMVT